MRAAKGEGSLFPAKGGGYRGYVTVDGRRKWFSAPTKAAAAQKRKDLIAKRDAGHTVHGRAWSVEEWMSHWLDTVAVHLKPYTRQTYRWTIDKVIVPDLGRVKLDRLTPERVEAWLASLTQSETSKQRFHGILRTALGVAEDRGHLTRNPATRVSRPKRGRPDTTSFSVDDALAILAALEGHRSRARWHVGLREGLRSGETLGLAWPDVNLDRGIITVRRQLTRIQGRGLVLQTPKTDAGARKVQISADLVQVLREHRELQLVEMVQAGDSWVGWEFDGEPVALVFSTPLGTPIDPRNDQREWAAIVASAGLPHARRHQARHTAATFMLAAGADVAVVAAKLGHADPSYTYRIYVHPLEARERELNETMDGVWGAPYPHPTEGGTGRDPQPSERSARVE